MIAVLGRGKSLKKYKKYSHLFDKIYIVGNFYKEIKKMGEKHFEGKKIVHVVSRTDSPLRNDYYNKLNFIKITTFYYDKELLDSKLIKKFKKENIKIEKLPKYMEKRGYPSVSRNIILKYSNKYNNYKELCKFLRKKFPKEIKEGTKDSRRSHYWPTTGIYALDLCLIENMPKSVYIFGIDCFKTLTYVVYNFDFKAKRDTDATRLMFYHIEELVKEFPSINFYSSSEIIKLNYLNWSLIS